MARALRAEVVALQAEIAKAHAAAEQQQKELDYYKVCMPARVWGGWPDKLSVPYVRCILTCFTDLFFGVSCQALVSPRRPGHPHPPPAPPVQTKPLRVLYPHTHPAAPGTLWKVCSMAPCTSPPVTWACPAPPPQAKSTGGLTERDALHLTTRDMGLALSEASERAEAYRRQLEARKLPAEQLMKDLHRLMVHGFIGSGYRLMVHGFTGSGYRLVVHGFVAGTSLPHAPPHVLFAAPPSPPPPIMPDLPPPPAPRSTGTWPDPTPHRTCCCPCRLTTGAWWPCCPAPRSTGTWPQRWLRRKGGGCTTCP